MGFFSGFLNAMNDKMQMLDEKSKEYYNKYVNFQPEKILKEMDNCGRDITKISALRKIYTEKARQMNDYELERITKEAESHCTTNTYNYALEIYQKETDRRDPWT